MAIFKYFFIAGTFQSQQEDAGKNSEIETEILYGENYNFFLSSQNSTYPEILAGLVFNIQK